MPRRRPVSRLLACSLLVALACGDSTPQDAKTPPPVRSAGETKVEPTPDAKAETPLPEDPFADDRWEDDDATGGEDDAPPPKPPASEGPWPGPCKVSYKGGPTLRFKHTDKGGTVRIDQTGDGEADTCGKFERKDGHVTKISIDLDCDKKTDLRIEPKPQAGSNLVTAKVTANADNGGNRELALVNLGVFAGLEPGYPIAAAPGEIETVVADGRVTKAQTKSKGEGATAIELSYDKDGRIKTIKEDLGRDGTVDRKFSYKFDAKGNPTRIDVVTTIPAPAAEGGDKPAGAKAKPTTKKQSATFDYACWK
ncbi:MAG: hypothetical protein U0168_02020 [Nannocystaceae bacterium]